MANRINKSLYFFVSAGILSVSVALYLFNQKLTLQRQLAEKHRQCEQRTVELTEVYQSKLDELRDEFAGNKTVTSVTTSSDPSGGGLATAGEQKQASLKDDELPLLERYDETLDELVARKYRFLLRSLKLSAAEREALRQLLIEREGLLLRIRDIKDYEYEAETDLDGDGDLPQLEHELAEVDNRIQELLDSDSKERYVLLKDSDNEQHHFNQYTLGINGLFPLSSQQQETVLLTRLRHKQAFEAAIASSGIDFDYPLTHTQRNELLATVERAAQVYKHRFLEDIREHLDHDNYPMDQYTLLENYTNTEFQALTKKLRERIDKRGVLNKGLP